jgi:hypothetical protein
MATSFHSHKNHVLALWLIVIIYMHECDWNVEFYLAVLK